MAKKKYYAVVKGKTPGIYFTWNDCKSQIDGVSGAVFKGFESIEDANAFMELGSSTKKSSYGEPEEDSFMTADEKTATAYVDGSYNASNHTFSYGVVLFWNGAEHHLAKQVIDDSLVDMRNVAGEICGAKAAMEFAVEKGCQSLHIYHDYEGISKWPLGLWKTNKSGTMAYKQYFDSISGKIKVTFHKVKGHSNNKYNDLADELAKSVIF